MEQITYAEFTAILESGLAEVIGNNEAGITYRMPDGRRVTQVYDGSDWEFYLLGEGE